MDEALKKHITSLRDLYNQDLSRKRLRLCLYGEKGHGKTTAVLTARKPIYLQSFDPGGAMLPQADKLVKEGNLVVDTRWESLDTKDPSVLVKWLDSMKELERGGLFQQCGTFVLDSLTFWSEFLMAKIIGDDSKNKTDVPQLQNYVPFQITFVNIMKGFYNLPCDVVITAHISTEDDDVTGTRRTALNLIGRTTSSKVMAAFSELWVAKKRVTSAGPSYRILTQGDGFYEASTRIGSGLFTGEQDPDITQLLLKAGWNWEEKPPLEV